MNEFTPQQIAYWRAYEKVRKGGRYNMFDPRAAQLAGLGRSDMMFVMKNYDALKDAAEKEKKA